MDCTGEITLPEGTDMVMPGDNVTITVDLIYPVALNVGLRFAIREGGRTVGAGQITEILVGNYFYGNSSVGRASVSKTECREFEPLFPC